MTFEPFQKVLVRSGNDSHWNIALFSYMEIEGTYHCMNGSYKQCIPYEGNEYLLGTTDNLPKLEFKFGDRVEVSYDKKIWLPAIFYRIRKNCRAKFCVLRPTGICSWPYCRRAN